MATMLEECTTEKKRSVVRVLLAGEIDAKNGHKEIFFVSRKAVHNSVEKFSHGRSKVADDETEVRNWLRQQSKYFYAANFEALVKQWDKRINVVGGYVDK
jgi:hypothetical protein